MKKMVLGIGIFICGLLGLCTDYIVTNVISAIPGVTFVSNAAVFSLLTVSAVVMLIGLILTVVGYREA